MFLPVPGRVPCLIDDAKYDAFANRMLWKANVEYDAFAIRML